MIPGEILHAAQPVPLNAGRPVTRLTVLNAADRPVQVGSHYHFAEANPGLRFDRAAAHGLRLNIAAGTAVRFDELPAQLAAADIVVSSTGSPHQLIGREEMEIVMEPPGVAPRGMSRVPSAPWCEAGLVIRPPRRAQQPVVAAVAVGRCVVWMLSPAFVPPPSRTTLTR